MSFSFLRSPLVVLLTLPAGIAFCIGLLPLPMVYLDTTFGRAAFDILPLQFDTESARTLLSVVAAGAMTALSLAYSLVLVVFTLAAGNIGPRLLKRFTTELVNQVTAGILGGTFLYALVAILFVHPDFVPKLTIVGALVLAVLSVFQLIYFVRNVSESITIDDEIASITTQLDNALVEYRNKARTAREFSDNDFEFVEELSAGKSGYIGEIAEESLAEVASELDIVIKIESAPGNFTLADESIIAVTRKLDESDAKRIRECINVEPARSESRPVEFSVNLLVEIALRALSPGVNDPYTAIAAIDSLSSAFSGIAREPVQPLTFSDKSGNIRLILPELSLKNMIGLTFHPLRRAAGHNIMVAQALARALSRLYHLADEPLREILDIHADLLIQEVRHYEHLDHDLQSVREWLPDNFAEAKQEKGTA